MGQISFKGKRISELIKELEDIKNTHGDLFCYSDRFGYLMDSNFEVSYIQEPKNKREKRKFWSEYTHPETDKGEKCLKGW